MRHYSETYKDLRMYLIEDLSNLFIEASTVQARTRGYENTGNVVISLWSEPGNTRLENPNTFFIGVTYERYLGFIDIISDFTGIQKEDIYLYVTGVFMVDPTFGQ